MHNGRGAVHGRFLPQPRRKIQADGSECRDWLKDQLSGAEVGEIATDAQCTKRAAENIRAGENGMRMEYLVAMCRNNPEFRAAFFEFCGGELEIPGDLTAMIQKYLRRDSV